MNIKLFANADANPDAGGNAIALPGLRPGELKSNSATFIFALSMKVNSYRKEFTPLKTKSFLEEMVPILERKQ